MGFEEKGQAGIAIIFVLAGLLFFTAVLAETADGNLTQQAQGTESQKQQDSQALDDENSASQSIPQPIISIVAPLSGQTVSETAVIVLKVENSEECVNVKVLDQNSESVFETNACKESNYITDWNSMTVENGILEITAQACNESICGSASAQLIVENQQAIEIPESQPQESQESTGENSAGNPITDNNFPDSNAIELPESQPIEEEFFIKGSNEFSMLALKDLNGNLLDSGSESLKAKKGKYNASIAFIDRQVKEIELENVSIDQNQTLLEIDENINERDFESPEGFFQQIIAVNPKAKFSKGIMRLNVPSGSKALFKCKEWVFEQKKCGGVWEKILEIENQEIAEIPLSASDPAFGFAKNNEVSFDRGLNCHKCGQHKAPPLTNVEVQVTAATQNPLGNAVLADFFPASWQLVDAQGGTVSDVNEEFKKIEWNIDLQNSASKTYTLQSPERTLPPTKYYFLSQLNEFSSEQWSVIVADPQSTTRFYFRTLADLTPAEPKPDTNISDDRMILGTERIYAMNETASAGIANSGIVVPNSTTNGNYRGINFTSPALAAQTILAGTWKVSVFAKASTTSSTADALRASIWVWDGATDTRQAGIVSTPVQTAALSTTSAAYVISLNGSEVTIDNGDKIVVEIDVAGSSTPATGSKVDINFSLAPPGDANVLAPQSINFYAYLNQPSITTPSSDNNNGINQYSNFAVQGTTTCSSNGGYDCGVVDTNLQYCPGTSCSNWMDLNSIEGSLQLASGANPQTATLTSGSSTASTWIVTANNSGTFELRLRADGNNSDANTSSGTDRTITIQAVAADYSFTISLPLTGCTNGKGCLTGGCSACTRCFFDASTGTGSDANFADRNQVSCQGQTASVQFFRFANSSTTSAENWDMNLDVALDAKYRLKIGVASTAYEASCAGTQPPTTGCVNISNGTQVRIANAIAKNADKNAWAWADFVSATPVVDYNRTLSHTSS